jgi:uncharacterized protein HemX
MEQQVIDSVNAQTAANKQAATAWTPPRAADTNPSIPVTGDNGAGAADSVSQAFLAGLAAQTKNTAGDTSPYVVIPNQADTGSGGGVSGWLLVGVAAIGVAVWYFLRKRGAV